MSLPSNPLLSPWTAPFGLPPFEQIKSGHFRPAFEAALTEHRAEIARIADDPAAPSFDNTIAALERSGRPLNDVSAVFWNLAAADTTPELQDVERQIAGVLSRHASEISMNPNLFRRIDALYAQRAELGLAPEELRVLELTHKNFVRAGARLNEEDKERLATILERLAQLSTQFSQNVLADESAYLLLLEESDLAALSADFRAAAARVAADRGAPGKYAVTLARSSAETFLQSSERRDLREAVFRAWTSRGENDGETDNRPIMAEILQLREQRAKLLGFASFADYALDDTMAKTPAAVRDLLDRVWTPALARAGEERSAIQTLVEEEGANFKIAAHDWRYYAEHVRKNLYDLDQAALRPYFQLENMIAAAFHVAERLFGLQFIEQPGLNLYQKDVRAFEVLKNGEHVALLLGDYFARPSKRSGAWMSEFRAQHKLDGSVRPIVLNVMNFTKGGEGEPTLLSLDDARTLFHEFGHALHGMLSDVTYPLLSGTNVARDFVELPSQLFEHWLLEPVVLRRFALRAETGEPMPDALVERIKRSRHFNQGFAAVEFCASAYVDLDLHQQRATDDIDVAAAERQSLERISMPQEIAMRHRPPHFGHIFSGDSYASGYYAYLWAEVLDADAFEAFKEAGDPFAPDIAKRLHDFIYSAGGRQDAGEAYLGFRGRMPTVEPLLRQRGFAN